MTDNPQTTARFMLIAFAGGLGMTTAIIIAVFATGATFGQRCERMYPGDPIAQEQCVERLANGK